MQKDMRRAWRTRCGSLVAAFLVSPACLRLFGGSDGAEGASAITAGASMGAICSEKSRQRLSTMLDDALADFERGSFKDSGFAGSLQSAVGLHPWRAFIAALRELSDVTYILGEVMLQFQALGAGLGDYGIIRAAPWFHPCLDALADKLRRLKAQLEQVNKAVDETIVFARARGMSVKKPSPSRGMGARAHAALERAVVGGNTHLQATTTAVEELRRRSAADRLPHVIEGLGTSCLALQQVLASAQFRACLGDSAAEPLPAIRAGEEPAVRGRDLPALANVAAWSDSESPCTSDGDRRREHRSLAVAHLGA